MSMIILVMTGGDEGGKVKDREPGL